MGILDQYKKALMEEEKQNMDFPSSCNLSDEDREEYESALNKMRNADFSKEEVEEAIKNSRRNMKSLGEKHNGGINENTMRIQMTRLTDKEMSAKDLLKETSISDIKVIRAYCPKCGKELVAKSPAMYNPFTMEKACIHECCGEKFNLDKTFPHIAFYDENNNEINTFM